MNTALRIAFLVLVAAGPMIASAQGADLCGNTNPGGVQDNPPNHRSPCHLPRDAHITQLFTYHWHSGAGAPAGTITLFDPATGVSHTFQATGSAATAGGPTVNWTANTSFDLLAGDYQIFDSDPATWSWNQTSSNNGFFIVRGDFTTAAAASAEAKPVTDCLATCNAPGGPGSFSLSCSAHGPHATCTPAIGVAEAPGGGQVTCTDGISTTVCQCLTVIGVGISRAGCTTH